MVDFIKFVDYSFQDSRLRENEYLNLFGQHDCGTAEILEGKRGVYRGLKFLISENRLVVEGSLPKYYHFEEALQRSNNYDDFGVAELRWVFDDLYKKFGIDPRNCVVKRFEFGLNIEISAESVKDVINAFVSHRGVPFYEQQNQQRKFAAKKCEHSEYTAKIYEKKSSNRPSLLRLELSFDKTTVLKRFKARKDDTTVNDNSECVLLLSAFLGQDVNEYLIGKLLTFIRECVYYFEELHELVETESDKSLIYKLNCPNYYRGFSGKAKDKREMVRKYHRLYDKYSTFNMKDVLGQLALLKFESLVPNWCEFINPYEDTERPPQIYHSISRYDSALFSNVKTLPYCLLINLNQASVEKWEPP